MKLITAEHRRQLLKNWNQPAVSTEAVVKIFLLPNHRSGSSTQYSQTTKTPYSDNTIWVWASLQPAT